jgi:hypothetical protein
MSQTSFIMVPFLKGGDARLHPGVPQRFDVEASARAVAASAAPLYAGVAVLEERDATGAEPRLVQALGRVPDLIAGLTA